MTQLTTEQWDNIARRLWSKVDKSGGPDACWPFLGCRTSHGYGQIRLTGRGARATTTHRMAFMLIDRVWLDRWIHICHRCDNPPCCNPAHLFKGTAADNKRDEREKGLLLVGEEVPSAKLTEDQVYEIRRLAADGTPHRLIAVRFGIHREHVRDIFRRKNWKHI